MPRLPHRFVHCAGVCAVALAAAPSQLAAQSVIAISPQQCVWRAGDNPAWAAPNLDERSWRPYAQWNLQPGDVHAWVRCHADLSSLRGVTHPAIQVTLFAAYQVFVDGKPLGGSGHLSSGQLSMNTIRSFALPKPLPPATTIALRVTRRNAFALAGLKLRAGEESTLRNRRAGVVLAQSLHDLAPTICFGSTGVIGFVLLGLFLYDPSRRDLLLLSIVCIGAAANNLNSACDAALVNRPEMASLAIGNVARLMVGTTRTWFFFALARRRVPLLFWLLIGLGVQDHVLWGIESFLPAAQALWLDVFRQHLTRPVDNLALAAACVAPFVAFWPYPRITSRMRWLAVLCMAWATTLALFYVVLVSQYFPGVPNLYPAWGSKSATAQAITTLCVAAGLLALLFREQRRIAEERAEMAGELRAASGIQRMLAPAMVDTAPGLRIEVAFRPMREVGGDFYLCRILPGNRQRLLVGDVSGKGTAAAMAAAMLLGGAEERDSDSPGRLLAHLNRVLERTRGGGFATCLCADFSGGVVTLANAGHLSPYRGGREVPIQPGLPLGIVASQEDYEERSFTLEPGDTLTFLSDGVVEARNSQGELFGFERTRAISTESAAAIAQAAQDFGQEDDITVLTLTRLLAGEQATSKPAAPVFLTA
ncbi:MAG: PP2C family protein-serine/threonine phosphatase [Terracidiphilus sp.]